MEKVKQLITSLFSVRGRRGTVRFMFPATITFMAMLGAAAITSTGASYIKLVSSTDAILAEDVFSIDVFAYAHVPVNAVDITLQFDPSSVKVTGVDTGESVITLWTSEPTISNSSVTLQGGTYRKGFIGEHKIATINLKAKKIGQSKLTASKVILLAGDGSGTPVAVSEASESKVSLYIYDSSTDKESIKVGVNIDLVTDIDGDGKVTLKDISAFMSAWYDKKDLYDFNGDGRMSFSDFSIILANFFFKE